MKLGYLNLEILLIKKIAERNFRKNKKSRWIKNGKEKNEENKKEKSREKEGKEKDNKKEKKKIIALKPFGAHPKATNSLYFFIIWQFSYEKI